MAHQHIEQAAQLEDGAHLAREDAARLRTGLARYVDATVIELDALDTAQAVIAIVGRDDIASRDGHGQTALVGSEILAQRVVFVVAAPLLHGSVLGRAGTRPGCSRRNTAFARRRRRLGLIAPPFGLGACALLGLATLSLTLDGQFHIVVYLGIQCRHFLLVGSYHTTDFLLFFLEGRHLLLVLALLFGQFLRLGLLGIQLLALVLFASFQFGLDLGHLLLFFLYQQSLFLLVFGIFADIPVSAQHLVKIVSRQDEQQLVLGIVVLVQIQQ